MEKELRMRLPKELKEQLEKMAKELNLTLSAFVRMKLTEVSNNQ